MPFYSLPSGASPVLAGDAPPTGGIGNDGDLFLDRTGKTLYGPKAAGAWPSGIDLSNGPAGPTGSAGPTGIGPTGATGVGATGPTGYYAFAATGPTAPTGSTMTQAGAVWLNTDNGRYYVRYDDAFLEIGVQGEPGRFPFYATGPTAPTAPTGSAWLDTDTGKYFLKYDDVFVEIGTQGERGVTGPTGTSFNWRGLWTPLETYQPNDVVQFSTSSFICKQTAFGITQFPFNTPFWSLMASGSVTGPTGASGADSTVTGPAGPTGTGFNWRGPWTSLATYAVDDVVSFSGNSWICILDSSSEFTGPPASSYWQQMTQQGPTGATGPQSLVTGPTGPGAGSARGFNKQTITGNITLASDAAEWQVLTPTGNALEVTLPTGISAGFDVKIINADEEYFYYFDVKTPAGVVRANLYYGSGGWFIWDGDQWRSYYLYNL